MKMAALAPGKLQKSALKRRDARERRDRIIQTALELFTSNGVEVPLDQIADRAQVGRGTLHRNFPDREALIIGVSEYLLDELSAKVKEFADRDDAFFLGIHVLAKLTVAYNGLEKIRPLEREVPSLAERCRIVFEELLAEPLARAKRAGLIRTDFGIEEVQLLALMVAGGGLDYRGPDQDMNIDRAMQLILRGLAPR
jgi:AcrR family transcriptional regulator